MGANMNYLLENLNTAVARAAELTDDPRLIRLLGTIKAARRQADIALAENLTEDPRLLRILGAIKNTAKEIALRESSARFSAPT